MPKLITISDGDSTCILCPALGGSVIGWSVGGQEMLRRADTTAIESGDPLSLASFPLVPYSNRIGNACFNWAGRDVRLRPNFSPEPHAIHGVGWTAAWTLEERGSTHLVVSLSHEADEAWPWSFAAEQRFSVENGSLIIRVSATNLSNEAAPLAFGHHPYFDQVGAHLSFTAEHVLMSGDDALPTIAVEPEGQFDFIRGGETAGRNIDHCYAGWDGTARISWADRPFALEIVADLAAAVVYIPEGGSAFCFEPVPHVNNVLNRPGDLPAMPVIAPSESFSATIALTAVTV